MHLCQEIEFCFGPCDFCVQCLTYRSRLTIIPQSASLFDTSIRDNLDPLQRYSDDQIWSAVEKCHLKPLVDKLGSGLSGEVGENGKNLSAGEKQLVSMARALLSNSKVTLSVSEVSSISFRHSPNQSINRPINQSINQEINQSIDQSIKKSINQGIKKSTGQEIDKSINQIDRFLMLCVLANV